MNEEKLKKLQKKLDVDKLTEEHQELIDKVGSCPLTTCNIIELMEQGDCMGLCLDIGRSEAVIHDPTKLIVKKMLSMILFGKKVTKISDFNPEKRA